jgi:hypothetical protein
VNSMVGSGEQMALAPNEAMGDEEGMRWNGGKGGRSG